jgi:hypothetical protein
LNGITWRGYKFPSVLDGKMDRDTICISSHTTGTTYYKN